MKPVISMEQYEDHVAWTAEKIDEFRAKGGLDRLSDFQRWLEGDKLPWVRERDMQFFAYEPEGH